MPRFVKKPVVINADQWDPKNPNAIDLAQLHGWKIDAECNVFIPTLEGVMTASPGDWIIRGLKGEYYPCKPDIFEMTYERVDE